MLATEDQDRRLAALDRYDVLDTPQEESFDRITRIVKRTFNVPIAHISMVDGHRQWFKSKEGFEGDETPLKDTLCKYAVESGRALVIPDAAADPVYAQNPFVKGDPGVRFYAGMPLTTAEGETIGTICAVDTKPRTFDADDVDALSDLARMVMSELGHRRLASTDALTGVMSRREFKSQAGRMVALALRHHYDASCLALDLDHFKAVNDRHGHAAGDAVLARAAAAWREVLRKSDLIGRLGGEEFCALLPHTPLGAALEVAGKLRSALADLEFEFDAQPLQSTVSIGVAALGGGITDLDELLASADRALYAAKAAGRNCCTAASPPASSAAGQRRRVLKGARILFNDRKSSMDCTVRSLSDSGAGIDISSSVGLPRTFDLAIPADKLDRGCRTLSRTEKHIEVEFV